MKKYSEQHDEVWERPSIEDLGEAQDIVKAINESGGGDELFNLLRST
jgi:hypothetical protein